MKKYASSMPENTSKCSMPLGYSMAGAAKMLSVSCRTIARLTKDGHLRPSKALRKKIYRHADLVRFLEETSR